MKSKEEVAEETIRMFFDIAGDDDRAKACAILCVQKIIEALPSAVAAENMGNARFDNPELKFWQSVLEILKR